MRAFPKSRSFAFLIAVILVAGIFWTTPLCQLALGQEATGNTAAPQPLITQPIDESQLTTLKGNTHPLARPEFDLGTAPASLPMQRMLLVLKRSPEQEFALTKLLDNQQDKQSPYYHKWLTPEEYGKQFGPTDYDMQVIVGWLQAHGFQVAAPSKGRTVIEFSGSASQVQEAFHTTIHKYLVNGEQHWANDRDPSIPTALTPAVAGIDSLNNFGRKPMNIVGGTATREKATGRITPHPTTEFTFAPGGTGPCNAQDSNCYFVGPYDFATIYSVTPQWTANINGAGQHVGILQETNINTSDPLEFRTMFSLPANNNPNVVLNGPDPGVVAPGSSLESEADLDVEWSNAVATGATIDLIVSASTDTTAGTDLSALYAVENNSEDITSESFGQCEAFLGGGNAFYYSLWEQAAAQGISVFVSTGDQLAAVCDPFQGTPPQPAVNGLAVNGIASTPFNVAVGGTDFQDFSNPETYWSLTNNANQASAKGYIPETTWNDSCTNALFAQLQGGSNNAETNCNNPNFVNFVTTIGGSGGASNCSTSSVSGGVITCISGTPKPNWQTGTGTQTDTVRDLPDASLFASGGFVGNAYIFCQSDITSSGSCDLNAPYADFGFAGGTSFGSPAMAGIMALVNQKMGGRQGNPNYVFYKLAAQTPLASSCNSTAGPNSACIFNDVTSGTIRTPCATGSLDCTTSKTGDTYGILNGYDTGTAYDLATGLGTINVNNLVNQWHTAVVKASATTLALNSGAAVNVQHGKSVPVQITAAHGSGGTGTPTGDVSLIALTGPSSTKQTGVQEYTLTSGSVTASTNLLPGGTYNVKAHYEGDSTFLGSDSPTVPVTITQEGSTTALVCEVPGSGVILQNCGITLDSNSNFAALTGGTIPYGDLVYLHAAVAGASGNGVPTGDVTLNDNFAIPGNPYPLSSDGSTATPAGLFNLPVGSHSITATYDADPSFAVSTSPALAFAIAPASTSVVASASPTTIAAGGTTTLTANLTLGTTGLPSFGNAPTGTVTFYSGTTSLGNATVSGTAGSGNLITASGTPATGTASMTTAPGALATGSDTVTAVYNGDSNYAASPTSPGVVVTVQGPDFSISAPSATVSQGGNTMVTITVTAVGGFNGTVGSFTCTTSTLPAEATCGAASPSTVTGSGTTTIQINAAALGAKRQVRRAANEVPRTGWMAVTLLPLVGLCLVGIPAWGRRRRALPILMLVALLVLLPSCAGSSGPPPNPVPSISSLSPTQQAAGSQSQALTINGTGFISSSAVTYNGTAHASTFVSASQLTTTLTASDMTTTGNFPVVVTNPTPGGGASSPVNFNVVTGTPVGTFNVTVTATSGTTQHSTTFALTVQ
jgi:hypothetical protein